MKPLADHSKPPLTVRSLRTRICAAFEAILARGGQRRRFYYIVVLPLESMAQ